METENSITTSGDGIFYVGLVLSIVRYMIPETTLELPVLLPILRGLVLVIITIQLIIAFPKYETLEKQIILLVFFFVILIGIGTQNRFGTIYSLFALIVGAKNIDFKSILNVYYKTGAILCITVVLFSYFGIIENRAVLVEGHGLLETSTIRYCMGYIWPTDFATHVFFILLAYWIAKDGRMTFLHYFTFSIIIYIVYRLSDSKLGCGCMILLLFFSCVLRLRQWLVLKFSNIDNYSFIKKILWMSYIPFLFAIMAYISSSYDEADPNWIIVDVALSGRLHISQEALDKEGYTWFGQEYELIGGEADENLYNYIDSSYLQALVIYGIVFSILLLLSYIFIVGQAYRRKDYTFLYAIIVVGISGAIAQHFLQVYMNPLWLALTANVMVPNADSQQEDTMQYEEMSL